MLRVHGARGRGEGRRGKISDQSWFDEFTVTQESVRARAESFGVALLRTITHHYARKPRRPPLSIHKHFNTRKYLSWSGRPTSIVVTNEPEFKAFVCLKHTHTLSQAYRCFAKWPCILQLNNEFHSFCCEGWYQQDLGWDQPVTTTAGGSRAQLIVTDNSEAWRACQTVFVGVPLISCGQNTCQGLNAAEAIVHVQLMSTGMQS